MRYVVLPIEDAKIVFTEKELETMRKNIDNTEMIVHEEILIAKREAMGMVVLSSEETGQIEWTYPVYDISKARDLLSQKQWNYEQ